MYSHAKIRPHFSRVEGTLKTLSKQTLHPQAQHCKKITSEKLPEGNLKAPD